MEILTFGSAELVDRSAPAAKPISIQAKRLALLAFLALAGRDRTRRRDRVVALFWPELDDEHARSALRQALSYLRRTLGPAAIATRGEDEVGLGSIDCDAVRFDEAIAAGHPDQAMALYAGDFLDGLFVSDVSAELEQWVDTERVRLRQSASTAAFSIATAARQHGDKAAAVEWGRRAAALAPDDEGRLRWLIALFDQLGDRGGALEAYDRFARRLMTEYSCEPSVETQSLMTAVRDRSVTAGTAPDGAPVRSPATQDEAATMAWPVGTGAGQVAGLDVGPDAKLEARPAAEPSFLRAHRRIILAGIAATAMILAIVIAAYWPIDGRSYPVLAVLPVRDLDADSTQPYLADALTDQLIFELGRFSDVRVINRRTMMTFRESAQSSSEVARILNADAVVQTTVRRMGDSVQLSVELSRTGNDRRRWKHTFPEASRDIPALIAKAADSVAGQMLTASRMMRAASTPRPVDSASFDFYIRGRYWWNKRGPGLQRSIGLFNNALDQDPTFAPAYAGMADAYVQLGYASLLRPEDAFPKARAAAQRALELDSSLAEPHATLGFVALYYAWDWPTAEREFQRALSINPGYATAHEWYGVFLAAMGRFDEARAQEDAAQALDPLSTAVAGTAAWVEYYAGQNAKAERDVRIALRTDSLNGLARYYLGRVLQASGSLDLALEQYRATAQLINWVPTVAAIGHVYGSQGNAREARAILSRLDSLRHSGEYVTAYGIALVYASLGERDSTFAWLDRGVAERTHWMVWLRRDPRWAPISGDPRFAALAKKLRLPP
ncbi:MAG: BTAD domain-containing putative transcriptional regulator [Gemmatimonadaceae bacterium]